MNAVWALVWTDLRLYFANRRALVMNVLAPIAIAAFFGYLFSDRDEAPAAIPIAVIDQDGSDISRQIVAAISADRTLAVSTMDSAAALEAVRTGTLRAVVVLPAGFGASAGTALFSIGAKPEIAIHYDPSQSVALQVIRGLLAQSVMQHVSAALFNDAEATLPGLRASVENSTGLSAANKKDLLDILALSSRLGRQARADVPLSGAGARPAFGLPYTVVESEVRARDDVPYNSYAHSFAGMGVQFVLMMGIELGVGLLVMRRLGLWRRLRAAPLSKTQLLSSRLVMSAITALLLMCIIYAAGMLLFDVRVLGSWPGFIGVLVSFSVLTASLGLLVAGIGRTPEATRGLAIFLTLILVMLGGAWVPSFVFPDWLQRVTVFVPTRWAVDGLDAMTWRGLDFSAAVWPMALMLGLAALCLVIAVRAFDWEE